MNKAPSIKQIMTPNPISVDLTTSISAMIELMEANDFDHLLVVDESELLCGIITKTDLYKKILSLSRSTSGKAYSEMMINNTTAQEVMTPNPVFITADQKLDVAIETFYNDKFHALPVLENNKLVGIITCKDILGAINDMQFNHR